ncbi:LacI family DNA-binding transcriptional regulator [Pelagerythrobacter aerophilus]|uniref:LacI family DNA-binding transcriptional regulator n=1 Tax=Pelagerythrobacter aerophilus TaxID=2306995 RepID=A0A418NHL3_9SPHN|nr:LacI family DNA-binding transcriptional regulator [Pelagerythrobacter aerophilus]RIV78096.1 LacI family DNA-binding transcriptional regulator [Pelagerythrobacter aerophilus]
MARGTKRSTIIDVAKLAQVSPKSVSRVFNNEPHITPALRKKVLSAAKELNYHPNVLAQGLVRRQSYLVGLIYEKPSPSYVVELQRGALERLHGERYRLVVLPVESVTDHPQEVVSLVRSAGLDGVILAPPASDHPEILTGLLDARIPFARIAPQSQLDVGQWTAMDDVAAAREIAEHVIGLGHRVIAVIMGDPAHAASDQRLSGYHQAFDAHGVARHPELVETGDFSFESGYEATRRLLSRKLRPTAILAQNDDMAVGAMSAARELGFNVPADLSIVGFDDSEIARIVWPRLTTVRQPVVEMAKTATDMLLGELAGDPPRERIIHGHQLVERLTAAPPPS